MHEYHIVEAVVKQIVTAAAGNNAEKVTRVSLVLGDQSGLEEGAVRLYFETISAGTPAAGAALEFVHKSASRDFFIENIEIEERSR